MSDRQSPENIQSQIDYIRSKKIKEAQDTIDYYKEAGANADLARYEGEIAEFEQDIINLENLLKEPKKLTTIKVKITEYKGNVVVETIDPNEFDQDYLGAGQGRIGCILLNNSRLAISQEALDAIGMLKRNRDCIGDFSGDAEHFSWCGGSVSVKDSTCEVSRDFKMPKGFQLIDNETSSEAIEYIDGKKEGSENIEYSEIEHNLWIDLTRSGSHQKQEDGSSKYVYNNYFLLNVRPLDKYIYDPEIKILNAPEGRVVVRDEGDSRKIYMSDEHLEQIKSLSEGIFIVNNKVEDIEFDGDIKGLWKKIHRKGSVHEDDIMSYINGFYELGFFNNCVNPHKHYWRMSIVGTPESIIKTLKKFKRA